MRNMVMKMFPLLNVRLISEVNTANTNKYWDVIKTSLRNKDAGCTDSKNWVVIVRVLWCTKIAYENKEPTPGFLGTVEP